MLIELTNEKAAGLLHELEELNIIRVLKNNVTPSEAKLSEKYRGVFSKEDAALFDRHVKTSREEWNDSI